MNQRFFGRMTVLCTLSALAWALSYYVFGSTHTGGICDIAPLCREAAIYNVGVTVVVGATWWAIRRRNKNDADKANT